MVESKLNIKVMAYLVLQIIFVIILLLLPQSNIIVTSIFMLLLGIVLLMHSNTLIAGLTWTKHNIYNFVIIILTVFFIPAYAAFHSEFVIIVGIAIIIANLVAILLNLDIVMSVNYLKSKSREFKVASTKKYRVPTPSETKNLKKVSKKKPKIEYKIVAISGGSKFHSLDCKMVENKARKRLKFYYSASDAQKDGLKPCKLCKAVSYMHQL
jgi:hypothetical protein